MAEAIIKQRVDRNRLTIHSDNGSPMASKPVASCWPTWAWPRHTPARTSPTTTPTPKLSSNTQVPAGLPDRFGSIQDARAFCQRFFHWYNEIHRRSGIAPTRLPMSTMDNTRPSAQPVPMSWPLPTPATRNDSYASIPSRPPCPRPPGSTTSSWASAASHASTSARYRTVKRSPCSNASVDSRPPQTISTPRKSLGYAATCRSRCGSPAT